MMRKHAVRRPILRSLRGRRSATSRRLVIESLEHRRVLAASISGEVIHDSNGNGAIDPTEIGQPDVRVFLDQNGNGELDLVGSIVEPDDVDSGQDFEEILPPGVTLSVAGLDNVPAPGLINSVVDNLATTGQQVFAVEGDPIFYSDARLRIDFETPVSSVAIDFAGSKALFGETGRLQIYNAQNVLLGTVDSPPVFVNEWATLRASRTQADISYAVAYTVVEQGGATGRLDSLRINSEGSEPWTITDAEGAYRFIDLDGGNYSVRQIVPTAFQQTLPANNAARQVTLAANQHVTGVNFANRDSLPPNAVDDLRQTWEATPIDIHILSNDVPGDAPLDPTSVAVVVDADHGTTSVNPDTGRVVYTPDVGFSGVDTFRYTVQATDGTLSNEGTVTIYVGDDLALWQNPINELDVDNDGGVFPIDALLIINELNEPQYRDPVTGVLPTPPDPIPAYFDVTGDDVCSAIDVLQIINFLNGLTPAIPVAAGPAPLNIAEGESDALPSIDGVGAALAGLESNVLVEEGEGESSVDSTLTVASGDAAKSRPLGEVEMEAAAVVFDGDVGEASTESGLEDDLLTLLASDLAAA